MPKRGHDGKGPAEEAAAKRAALEGLEVGRAAGDPSLASQGPPGLGGYAAAAAWRQAGLAATQLLLNRVSSHLGAPPCFAALARRATPPWRHHTTRRQTMRLMTWAFRGGGASAPPWAAPSSASSP